VDSPYSKGTDTPYSKDGECLWPWSVGRQQHTHMQSPVATPALSKPHTTLARITMHWLAAGMILPACPLLRCAGAHTVEAMASLEGAQEPVLAQQP
jgi:hypothetical protein